jgi:ubiquinone/menaquinone biosynthesis C-methylase UbiE
VSARTITIRSGDYLAAIVGLAILRDLFHEPDQLARRADELRRIAAHATEFPYDFDVNFVEEDVEAGYTEWSASYDAPVTNPAIITEEELVLPMLARLPRGRALDVACGTGRHVGNLLRLGFDASGVDVTAAMLDRAREKHPEARFEQGSWDALPFGDDEFDVVTCALALCHAPAVAGPIAEMARVLRPGGALVVSDIHPNGTLLGGAAAYPGDGYDRVPFVRNHMHPLAEYFAALRAAGLVVEELHEHGHGEETAKLMPSYAAFPEATVRAFRGAAGIVAWLAVKP